MEGINCDPFTFNTECTELNSQWKKNQERKDIKAHQYIISFAPEDTAENGLTVQKAQKIAMDFARKYFAGHQVIVATHADGDNHSGNMHCHIILNSLRKYSVDRQRFMERPNDALAGYKHHQTRGLLENMQEHLNAVCEKEHLKTAAFGTRSDVTVNDREYRAAKRGQKQMDARNAEMMAAGVMPRKIKFSTIKQEIRNGIDIVAAGVDSFHELVMLMDEKYGIKVTVSRGRLSFKHPAREKPISERSLGRYYGKTAIEDRLGADRVKREELPPEFVELSYIFLAPSHLQLVTDLQDCVKAQQSKAYARKVTVSNIQKMADTLSFLQENGIGSVHELENLEKRISEKMNEQINVLDKTELQIEQVNEQIHHLGQYYAMKKTYDAFLHSTDKAHYRNEHRNEIAQYEESRDYLKQTCGNAFPKMKELKKKRSDLLSKKSEAKKGVDKVRQTYKQIGVARSNVESMLSMNRTSVYKSR